LSTPSNINNLLIFKNSQGTEARGTLLKLSRTTIVFEVYNPYSIVQLSEVLQELKIFRGEQPIYEGKAVVSNLMNTGLMLVVSATLVDSWSDLTESIESQRDLEKETHAFISAWKDTHKLRPGYQIAVEKIRSFLGEMSGWLEQIDLRVDDENYDQSKLINEMEPPIVPFISNLVSAFEEEARKVPENETAIHKQFAQKDIHPFVMTSPFTYRTFHKPLGYAGDYEMVNMIMRNPHEGSTIYTKLMNAISLYAGPALAHRNRITILENKLNKLVEKAQNSNSTIKILNIGCGPAVEVQQFIRNNPLSKHCQFRFIDFNEETINYTKEKIEQAMGESNNHADCLFIQQSVHNLLKLAAKKEQITDLEQFDFLYCAGLFDYLSDKVCASLLKLFTQHTKPGGTVLVTNVHPSNPYTLWMEHIMEWYLIYRDENKMIDLSKNLGERKIYLDESGINIFMELKK